MVRSVRRDRHPGGETLGAARLPATRDAWGAESGPRRTPLQMR